MTYALHNGGGRNWFNREEHNAERLNMNESETDTFIWLLEDGKKELYPGNQFYSKLIKNLQKHQLETRGLCEDLIAQMKELLKTIYAIAYISNLLAMQICLTNKLLEVIDDILFILAETLLTDSFTSYQVNSSWSLVVFDHSFNLVV